MTKRKKPTGDLGFVSLGGGSEPPVFHPIQFPETKDEIEDWILQATLQAAESAGLGFLPTSATPRRNPENHFDYTLTTEQGEEYLDLMEIVVLPPGTKGGHKEGVVSYHPRAMAEAIWKNIVKKSKRYGLPKPNIHLLLYVTDWRFRLVQTVSELLACRIARRHHVFCSVSYFAPDDEQAGEFVPLFPLSSEVLEAYSQRENQLTLMQRQNRHTLILLGDPTRARSDGPGRIVFPTGKPSPEGGTD